MTPTLELRVPEKLRGRVGAIDELRGLALLLIILYHAGGVLVWQNFLHGDLGVDIFVVLSGVGIGLGSREEGAGAFLRRRLARILPAYWIVLTAFLAANTLLLGLRYSVLDVVAHFLGIQGLFGDAIAFSIDDSFWFITLIVGWYGAYALLRRRLARADQVVLWGGVLSCAVAYAYFETGQAGCFGHIGLRLPGFFAGLILGRLLRDGRIEVALTPALGLGLLAGIYFPYTHGIVITGTVATGLALAAAYLFLWKARAQSQVAATVSRDLRFLGTYSLEIFLIHQPLMRDYNLYVQARFLHDPNPSAVALMAGMAAALAVTLAVSVWVHRLLGSLLAPAGAT
jgi:peptidoglycan/LPS O-acetylase OafA/YrhL